MQCSHCGKGDWVTIGNQSYCTHCGNPQAGVATATQAPSPQITAPAPIKAVSDVRPIRNASHANDVHSGPALSSPAVLDLRTVVKPTPPVATVTAAPVAAPAEPEPQPEPVTTPVVAVSTETPIQTTPAEPPAQEARLARAAAVNKSDMIRRFVKPTTGIAQTEPGAPSTVPTPVVPVVATPPVQPTEVAPTELPALAATQLAGLRNHLPTEQPAEHHKPSPKAVLATTLAIAAMGVFIWANNIGNLTITAASQKAGINATVPSYIPSSYSLSGPVSYGPGYLTMQFKSPSNPGPLVLTQRRTEWSSASLKELFVTPKTKDYVTVQTQGLTIYIYNNNQATWVNHGIQYVVEGNTHLSKEQIIKIAESL